MKADYSVCYAASKAFLPYLKLSIASLPEEIEKIVVWYAPEGDQLNLATPNVKIINWNTRLENWQRAKAMNFAVEHAETEWILLADADMIFPAILFSILPESLTKAHEKTIFHFFVGRLNSERTALVLSGKKRWQEFYEKYEGSMQYVPPSLLSRFLSKFCRTLTSNIIVEFGSHKIGYEKIYGSINPCIFNKGFFSKLGGYDINFIGWGGEDDDLERRAKEAGAVDIRLPIVIAHLWHPRIMDFKNYLSESTAYAIK